MTDVTRPPPWIADGLRLLASALGASLALGLLLWVFGEAGVAPWEQLAALWQAREDWSGRSINFWRGGASDAALGLVPLVAIWVGVASALQALLARRASGSRSALPYALLLLAGWLALDLHWQEELWQRLRATEARYQGLDAEARALAGPDGAEVRFLAQVRAALPETPVRLFILSASPEGSRGLRARYHLMPHNSLVGLSTLPSPDQYRAGDYLLVLMPMRGIGYDRAAAVLLTPEGARLPAKPILSERRGALFQLTGEGG